jgi:hypothetical protein
MGMADKPSSPFAGLDKALLRSTKQTPSPSLTGNDQHGIKAAAYETAPPPLKETKSLLGKTDQHTQTAHQSQSVRPYERPPVRQYARTKSANNRHLIRHPFEFFEDQVAELRRITLEAQLRGEKVSMSEMVREAVDTYLQKKTRTPVR